MELSAEIWSLLPHAFFALYFFLHLLVYNPCLPVLPIVLPTGNLVKLFLILITLPVILFIIHNDVFPFFLLSYIPAALYSIRYNLDQPRITITPETFFYVIYMFFSSLLPLNTSIHQILFGTLATFATLHTVRLLLREESTPPITIPPRLTTTSLYSLLTFSWLSPLIATGHRGSLAGDDVPSLDPEFASTHAANHLAETHNRVLATNPHASLLSILSKAFGRRVWLACILGIVRYFVSFVPPIILRYILLSLQQSAPVISGIRLAFALFVTLICQSMLAHQWFIHMSCTVAQLRGALNKYIYSKSTKLSVESRATYTTGQIQNLMGTDAYNISEGTLDFTFVVVIVQQFCIVLFLLQNLLGWVPAIATFTLLSVFSPLQVYLMTKTKHFREAASSLTDERVKLVSEGIKGIKLVKLYAWEIPLINKILETRVKELTYIRKVAITQAFNTMMVTSLPTLLVITAFASYLAVGNTLDAAVVFPVIAMVNIVRAPVSFLPLILLNVARAMASISRLEKFLNAEELTALEDSHHAIDQEYLHLNNADIAAYDASFTWDPSDASLPQTLSSVTFEVPKGSLVAVVGPTGSGKSALLSAFLSELTVVSGKAGLRRRRSISYCDQIPFIQNATLRDNILFGKPFHAKRYQNTIRVCALQPDLEMLPAEDQTEIGGRGVNLSGGQRARVSLARAVYARADIYLLDDPLCAVDARVGKAIFTKCIVSALRGTTRLLTTNQIHFAASPDVDFVMVVKDGKVVEMGARASLLACETSEFSQLVRAAGDVGAGDVLDDKVHEENKMDFDNETTRRHESAMQSSGKDHATSSSSESEGKPLISGETKKSYGSIKKWRLTKDEAREHGRVRLKHYGTYLRALGIWRWVLPFLLFALGTKILTLSVDVLFSNWSERHDPGNTMLQLTIFVGLGLTSVLTTAGAVFSIAYGSLRASGIIHKSLLMSVLGAPSGFFHATPDGQIINRFHSDMDRVDSLIIPTFTSVMRLTFDLIFTIGIMIWASPWTILAIVPMISVCVIIQEYYRKCSVDVRRLESIAKSPLYSHFSQSLDGMVTIRAYKNVPRESQISGMHSDNFCKTNFARYCANRWLGARLDCVCALLIFLATVLTVSSPALRSSVGKAGLVLSYVIQMLYATLGFVRQFTLLESDLSSVERISEYSAPTFPQEEKGGLKPLFLQKRHHKRVPGTKIAMSEAKIISPSGDLARVTIDWPRDGRIDFEDVEMRYRADLDPALKNISFVIKPGENIGIVGRTGAGKSSAINCLFRLQELGKGRILIDGTDIASLPLHDVRSSIGIIPQEPVCFSGTIRSNLDMCGEYSENEVQKALDECGLQSTTSRKITLTDEVTENGSNLSVGQRQLLCLGRVLLKESKVLVLDEATSSVTNEIDEIMQTTIREKMQRCTIMTIAHRLHTVMRSDKIMVMDRGEITEVGAPYELLSRQSMFSAMVDETGPATAAYLREMAVRPTKG